MWPFNLFRKKKQPILRSPSRPAYPFRDVPPASHYREAAVDPALVLDVVNDVGFAIQQAIILDQESNRREVQFQGFVNDLVPVVESPKHVVHAEAPYVAPEPSYSAPSHSYHDSSPSYSSGSSYDSGSSSCDCGGGGGGGGD